MDVVGYSLFEFVESKIFSTQINQLGIEIFLRIQSDLVQNPERGAIIKVLMVFGKPESQILPRSAERAAAIDTYIYTLSTLAEFTCCTSSAKVSKQTCRLRKNES